MALRILVSLSKKLRVQVTEFLVASLSRSSRLTHELQWPVLEDETLINGLLEGMIYHVYHVKTSTEAKMSDLF